MKQKLFIISIIYLMGLPGCVTVKLDKGEDEKRLKASNVITVEPGFNFTKRTSNQLDGLWINQANGNSISYVTSCNDPIDQSLKSIRMDILSKLDEPEIKTSNYVPFAKRKALRSQVNSIVDGYETKLDIVILKRQSCVYIINYVANKNFFNTDKKVFEKFLNGFRVTK